MIRRINYLILFLAGLVGVVKAQESYSWSQVRMGGGGFVTGIITCPTEKNLIYARTDVGGAYRWDETNKKWISLLDWLSDSQWPFFGVEALAVDPQSPNKVYMSCGLYSNSPKNILRSSDYGQTFQISSNSFLPQVNGNGMGRNNGERLAVDPNKGDILFCGYRNSSLYKSTDGAVNWTKVTAFPSITTSNGNGICALAFDPSSGTTGNATQRIFAAVSRTGSTNLYISEDGGATWNSVTGAITTYMPMRLMISNGYLYVTYADAEGPWNSSKGGIWKYNISARSWTDISPAQTAFSGITADKSNPNTLIASTINVYYPQYWGASTVYGDRIYRSTDGGSSWTELFSNQKMTLSSTNLWESPPSLHWAADIQIDPFNSDRVFVTSGNGLFSTENLSAISSGKSTWTFQVNGLEETVPLGLISIPGGPLVSVIGDYDGFVHQDITVTPSRMTPSVGTNTAIDFAGKSSSDIVRAGDEIFYSTNTGSSWTKMSKPAGIISKQGKITISTNGTTILWTPKDTIYRTTNKGVSWTKFTGFIYQATIVADPVNDNKFYAYNPSDGKFYLSTDGGVSFNSPVTLSTSGKPLLRTVPGREGDVWVALGDYGLTRTTNSGTTFVKSTNVTQCLAIGFGKEAPGKSFPSIYIWGKVSGGVSYPAMYRSIDEGATWVRINDDNHEFGGLGNGAFVLGDANVYGRVYMSSLGRGVIYGEIAGSTAVSQTKAENKFCSFQSTVFDETLSFFTSKPALYRICETSGRIVESGTCDGSCQAARNLTPGVYILNINAFDGEFVVKKVLKK